MKVFEMEEFNHDAIESFFRKKTRRKGQASPIVYTKYQDHSHDYLVLIAYLNLAACYLRLQYY